MFSEIQILSKFDMSSATDKMLRKANLASAKTARLKAENETDYTNFALWALEKKKEQFLTIDRF